MNIDEFSKKIKIYLNIINIKEETEYIEELYKFMQLLLEWNEKINLTAITDENEVILKHFIDSIMVKKYIESNKSIIDIGTGAGFPGIPLKTIMKNNNFLLLDSLNKRIKFLNEVIKELNLKDIEAIHYRAEEAGRNEKYREKFDYAISRAVSKLNILVEYMLPFVKVGGKCICMKGPNIDEEIIEAKNAIKILGGKIEKVEEYYLPNSDMKRTLIIIKKEHQISNKYPRNSGTPSSKPL